MNPGLVVAGAWPSGLGVAIATGAVLLLVLLYRVLAVSRKHRVPGAGQAAASKRLRDHQYARDRLTSQRDRDRRGSRMRGDR